MNYPNNSAAILSLISQIDKAIQKDDNRTALELVVELAIKYQREYYLEDIVELCEFTSKETMDIRDRANAGNVHDALVYAIIILDWDEDSWAYYLNMVAEAGNPIARYIFEKNTPDADYEMFVKISLLLANQGCAQSFPDLVNHYENVSDWRQAAIYAKSSYYAGFDTLNKLNLFLWEHPVECCPYGTWIPQWDYYFEFTPPAVREEVRTWLKVGTRKKLNNYLKLQICSYIITK